MNDNLSFTELNRGSKRRRPIQRSMSDRRDKDANETLGFKDTTALRAKHVRPSPQQLFQRPVSLLCQRPSSPPPKLPISTPTRTAPAIPQRPPRQQSKYSLYIFFKHFIPFRFFVHNFCLILFLS